MLTPTDSRRAPCSVCIGFVAEVTSSWVGEESSVFSWGLIFSSLMVVGVEKGSDFRSVGGRRNLERTPGGGKRAGHAAVLNPWPRPSHFRQGACNKGKQMAVFTGRGAGCFLAGITGRGLDWWKPPPTHRSKRSNVPLRATDRYHFTRALLLPSACGLGPSYGGRPKRRFELVQGQIVGGVSAVCHDPGLGHSCRCSGSGVFTRACTRDIKGQVTVLCLFPRFPNSPAPKSPKWVRGPVLGAQLIGRWAMSRAEKNS